MAKTLNSFTFPPFTTVIVVDEDKPFSASSAIRNLLSESWFIADLTDVLCENAADAVVLPITNKDQLPEGWALGYSPWLEPSDKRVSDYLSSRSVEDLELEVKALKAEVAELKKAKK